MALPDLPLKDYDESQLGYILRLLMVRLHASQAATQETYLVQRYLEAAYGIELVLGFGQGLFAGIMDRYAVLRSDFQRDFALIRKLFGPELEAATGKAFSTSLTEFFVRPLFEQVPTGLRPETGAAAQRLLDMFDAVTLLSLIGLIDDQFKAHKLFDQLGAGVDELLEILTLEGQAWARSLVLEPNAVRQGAMLGKLIGSALFEIVRIVVEPPALDAVHLISSLGLTSAEQKALGN